MSLVFFSRWQDWGHIIFVAHAFLSSEGCSCLLAQRRSRALRSLKCLWLCSSSPAVRGRGSQKRKGGRKKCLSASTTSVFMALYTRLKEICSYRVLIRFQFPWVWSLMVNFSKMHLDEALFRPPCVLLSCSLLGEMCGSRDNVCWNSYDGATLLWPELWHW